MLPLFSVVLDGIIFILTGNDDIHKSLDEFEIWPDQTIGFHKWQQIGLQWQKRCHNFFSAVFHPILFILADNNDKHENSEDFAIWPDPTTDCGVYSPRVPEKSQ